MTVSDYTFAKLADAVKDIARAADRIANAASSAADTYAKSVKEKSQE
jgi:hypothetical protein